MVIIYNSTNSFHPQKANKYDSGYDLYIDQQLVFDPFERKTISLKVCFKIQFPWYMKFLKLFGLGIEAQIRPKSGRSKNFWDVELGTIDELYRGYVGVTITNAINQKRVLEAGEKVCQIVFVPVFNNIKLKSGEVSTKTERSIKGFGSSGIR